MASAEALAAISPYAQNCGRSLEIVAADLERFCALLAKWNVSQNLVSRETVGDIWQRHVSDSLQVLPRLKASDRHFVDIGSGGGFPALPLAAALKGKQTDYVLIESSAKKASFLRAAIRELEVDAMVHAGRVDDFRGSGFDVVTARAVAALPVLLGMIQPLFGPQTRGILHKGREYRSELEEAAALWHFDVLTHRSETDPSSVLLEISNLQRRQ